MGSIYGFLLTWGPLIWGLIGLAIGLVLGFVIKLIFTRRYNDRLKGIEPKPEVVLIIECKRHQLEIVKDILWAHHAIGVRKLDHKKNHT